MNNINLFLDIGRKYGRTALRLIRRHERCSRKLARYANHLTFLTRCTKNHIVPRDLQVRPPVPIKGARRVAELASIRFLRERIRLAQSPQHRASHLLSMQRTRRRYLTRLDPTPSEYLIPPKTTSRASLKNVRARNRLLFYDQQHPLLIKLTGSSTRHVVKINFKGI